MPAVEPVVSVASAVARSLHHHAMGVGVGVGVGVGGARASLLHAVDFEEAGDYRDDPTNPIATLKHKYLLLKHHDHANNNNNGAQHPAKKDQDGNALPTPKHVLFPVASVKQGWRHGWQVGSGMQNFGNTCYLNSTLQAVFHVSAFANWLLSENHLERCGQQNACIICGMKRTLLDTQNSSGPIKPWQIYNKLRSICRHLTPGRQEDAHEFLRYLVEAMEKAYLSQFDGAISQLDQYSKETTPLNQILGGYLRTVVRCLACCRVSTTFQHFQDLLVDARKASTVDESLELYFAKERLEDLGYKCEFCNKKVSATKQFYIERPPMVLCIALKRFSMMGGKLTKHVQFRPQLSLDKHMFNRNPSQQLNYRLVSIVTHLGHSQNCGHYTAAGIGPNGSFYQFDDSSVREIPMSQVLNINAYILFYELVTQSNSNGLKGLHQIASLSSMKDSKEIVSNFIGPVMPTNVVKSQDENGNKSLVLVTTENSGMNGTKPKIPFMSLHSYPSSSNGDSNDSGKDKTIAGSSTLSPAPLTENKSNSTPSTSNNKLNGLKSPSNPVKVLNFMSNNKLTNINDKCVSVNDKDTIGGESKTNSHEDLTKTLNGNNKSNLSCIKVKLNEMNGGSSSTTIVSSPLVPYDSESSRDNNPEDDPDDENYNLVQTPNQKQTTITSFATKSTSQDWKVSREVPDNHRQNLHSQKNYNSKSSGDGIVKEKETITKLQHLSHRGYGASISTWVGTHSQMDRQVFEDKKNELKRGAEAEDEMDRGRIKKMKHNHHFNRHYNQGNFNPFQDNQNHKNKFFNGHRGNFMYRHPRTFRFKSRGRHNSHFSRHHSNYHHQQFGKNH